MHRKVAIKYRFQKEIYYFQPNREITRAMTHPTKTNIIIARRK